MSISYLHCDELNAYKSLAVDIKLFSCSIQLRMKFVLPIKKLNTINLNFFPALQNWAGIFFLLINIKMPTIVGILILINRKNFMLNWVEYEKCFITSGPGRRYKLLTRNICKTTDVSFLSKYVLDGNHLRRLSALHK